MRFCEVIVLNIVGRCADTVAFFAVVLSFKDIYYHCQVNDIQVYSNLCFKTAHLTRNVTKMKQILG